MREKQVGKNIVLVSGSGKYTVLSFTEIRNTAKTPGELRGEGMNFSYSHIKSKMFAGTPEKYLAGIWYDTQKKW